MRSKILSLTYFAFCLLIINISSFFEEEFYIDGIDIKNACEAHRALVVDDIRDVTAPIAALFIIPLLIIAVKLKCKSWLVNIMTLSLIAYWVWRFFIRIMWC
ncbi:YjeO family protein [Xenorhabdus hominickii]|uniref:Membrane protein n=1 Tax=Xenorhabdus hominickii TaxID=351679 RepID=A0A1V0M4F4_XENHO|nr:YjeO family protein [Xenorhabdus hominickii]ARD69754.1 Inner membrane protein YjeO [Xenorhabdus hominickii]PHM51791.1 membrane protein [Xenorhabdus hominickii]